MTADMFTGLGVLFSKAAQRTSRHLFLFPLRCIWKIGSHGSYDSTSEHGNFNATKKIMIRWMDSKWMKGKAVQVES